MATVPFFSVVIPTYNHARFIGQCLDSLRRQTFADWQAVVVNNYSQDDTEKIVADIGDPRITFVNFRNHGVIAASRNEGIRQSCGRYIAFLDSDDEWLPDKLQRVFEVTQSNPSVVLLSHLLWEREAMSGKERLLDCHRPYPFGYRNMLLYGNHLLNSATVVQRDFLERNTIWLNENPDFVSCEDYDLWLQCARHGAKYLLIDQILGVYSISVGGESKNPFKHYAHVKKLVHWHCHAVQTFSAHPTWLYYRATAAVDLAVASRLWHSGQTRRALMRLMTALAHNPSCCLNYIRYVKSRARRRRDFSYYT